MSEGPVVPALPLIPAAKGGAQPPQGTNNNPRGSIKKARIADNVEYEIGSNAHGSNAAIAIAKEEIVHDAIKKNSQRGRTKSLAIANGAMLLGGIADVEEDQTKSQGSTKRNSMGAGSSTLSLVTQGSRKGNSTKSGAQTSRLPARTSEFDGTFSSTTSVETLRGRVRALEGVVASTARLDPIASWPVKPSTSMVSASQRGGHNTAARPPLAVELEGFIRREMRELTTAVETPTHLQMIPIFREAFGCLVNHFHEYKGLLSLIKSEYDAVVDELSVNSQLMNKLQREVSSMKEIYSQQLHEEREKQNAAIADLQAQLAAALKQNHKQRVERSAIEKENVLLKETIKEREVDIDEGQDRLRLLTSTTRELGAKNSVLVKKLGAAQTQNEHLLHLIGAMEDKIRQQEDEITTQSFVVGSAPPTNVGPRKVKSPERAMSTVDVYAAVGHATKPTFRKTVKEAVMAKEARRVSNDHSVMSQGSDDGVEGDSTRSIIREGFTPYSTADNHDLREIILELESKVKKLQKTNIEYKSQINNLLMRIERIQQSRDEDTLTPRPNWTTVQKNLPEFHVNHLQTTDEIIHDLVHHIKDKEDEESKANERAAYSRTVRIWLDEEDMIESDLADRSKHFIGKGTGPHVPMCLRWSGKVRNKRMKKGDLEQLLSKFWSERKNKYRMGDSLLTIQPMQDFYYSWLVNLTGSEKKAVELAYNMFHVCEKYQSDPDCSLFLKIFRGEISETAIFDQFETVEKLREVVEKHDKQRKGVISRVTLQRIMNAYFRAKSTDDMLRLRFALVISCRGHVMVDYKQLFAEDEDGNQSRFVEMVRQQHVQEISSFVVEVEEALRDIISEETQTITMGSARQAIRVLDSKFPDERITEALAYACKMTVMEFASVGDFYSTVAEPFLARIRCGMLLKRFSPKLDDEDDFESASDDEKAARSREVFDDAFFTEEELAQVSDMINEHEDSVDPTGSGVTSSPTGIEVRRASTASTADMDDTAKAATANNRYAMSLKVAPTKADRERIAKVRRATNMEQQVSDALQEAERERIEELEKRKETLDTFSLFAQHPTAAAAINLNTLNKMRKDAEEETEKAKLEQSRLQDEEGEGENQSTSASPATAVAKEPTGEVSVGSDANAEASVDIPKDGSIATQQDPPQEEGTEPQAESASPSSPPDVSKASPSPTS